MACENVWFEVAFSRLNQSQTGAEHTMVNHIIIIIVPCPPIRELPCQVRVEMLSVLDRHAHIGGIAQSSE